MLRLLRHNIYTLTHGRRSHPALSLLSSNISPVCNRTSPSSELVSPPTITKTVLGRRHLSGRLIVVFHRQRWRETQGSARKGFVQSGSIQMKAMVPFHYRSRYLSYITTLASNGILSFGMCHV